MNILQEISSENQTNQVKSEDSAIHNWYRFVLSFPPHLVKHYFDKFRLNDGDTVLDPFCGTGTTLIEAKLSGFDGVGLEANPIVKFAAQTKLDWRIDSEELIDQALDVSHSVHQKFLAQGIDDRSLTSDTDLLSLRTLPEPALKLLIKNSISPLPLHKSLVLLDEIEKNANRRVKNHLLLAFAKVLVKDASNLRFGPEVGVGKIKEDAIVVDSWVSHVRDMALDLKKLSGCTTVTNAEVHLADARSPDLVLDSNSVHAVITSPPYPNEKDYSRTTRLESVFLGIVSSMTELRSIKKTFVRSNTRGIYKEDTDDEYIKEIKVVHDIAKKIEARRIALNKTSGFEKLYPKVTLQYFGGMARHLANLRASLVPGALLAYVVGDQASYLKIMIRTGGILAEIAESLGYQVLDIELFRTRFATATKEELREEVVLLRYVGDNGQ